MKVLESSAGPSWQLAGLQLIRNLIRGDWKQAEAEWQGQEVLSRLQAGL